MKRMFLLILPLLLLLGGCGSADWEDRYAAGIKHYTEGRYQQAAEAFEAVITENPDVAEAYEALAKVYEAMEQTEKAADIRDRQPEGSLLGAASTQQRVEDEDGGYHIDTRDANGRLIRTEFHMPDGCCETFTYNSAGGKTSRICLLADGRTDLEEYFDEFGQLIRVVGYREDGSYQRSDLDSHGNALRAANYSSSGTLLGIDKFTYNAAGHCTEARQLAADGTLLSFYRDTCDAAGILQRRDYYDGQGNLLSYRIYASADDMFGTHYDAGGALIQ